MSGGLVAFADVLDLTREARDDPPPVTRGELDEIVDIGIDWVNCTFPAPAMSVEALVAMVGKIMARPVSGVSGKGLLGFSESIELWAGVGSSTERCGAIAFGGGQGGRWLFQLTGAGCRLVADWSELSCLLEGLDGRLTRVDVALDLVRGSCGVDYAVDAYNKGRFQARGPSPSSRRAGEWDGACSYGRTFYVGKAENGKVLRVYEKGKQLGDPSSVWVRWEVQFGNRDRVLPFAILERPGAFFAGAYPVTCEVLKLVEADQEPERVKTTKTEGEVSIGHLVFHMRRAYGRVVDALEKAQGFSISEFVQEVRVSGRPRRVHLSSLEAGVEWRAILATVDRKRRFT